MTPAHTIRTIAAAVAVTLAVGTLTAVCRGPLQPATRTNPTVHDAAGRSLAALLAGPLAPIRSTPARVSEAVVSRPLSPCRHNHREQLVTVSIKHQHAWACSGSRTVLSTPVTTGRASPGDATPRGTFSVEARVSNTTLRPSNGHAVHVRYWIPFRNNVWGFHDAPWQAMPFGSSRYRAEGSLGCVHVPLHALRQLFGWVHDGTTVQIR